MPVRTDRYLLLLCLNFGCRACRGLQNQLCWNCCNRFPPIHQNFRTWLHLSHPRALHQSDPSCAKFWNREIADAHRGRLSYQCSIWRFIPFLARSGKSPSLFPSACESQLIRATHDRIKVSGHTSKMCTREMICVSAGIMQCHVFLRRYMGRCWSRLKS